MTQFENVFEKLMSNAEAARDFGNREQQMGEMIHYSVAEQWTIE